MAATPEAASILPTKVDYGSAGRPSVVGFQEPAGAGSHPTRRGVRKSIHNATQSVRNSRVVRSSVMMVRQSMARRVSIRDVGGTSSMASEMFNLTKNLVGAGALGIPSGIAALAGASRSGFAMLPAAIIILIMGAIFTYYFVLIARVCRMSGASSYGEAWHLTAGSKRGPLKIISPLVPASIVLMAGLSTVAYSMILADTSRSLLARFGIHAARNKCLMWVTVLVLFPLSMVKKMSILAPFSAIGTGGIVFTLIVMALRCFDGTYDAEHGGKYLDSTPVEMQPLFETDETVIPMITDIFLLLCMCFQSFFCHYNSPRYYMELQHNTVERFSTVCYVAFGTAAGIYFVMGSLGYYTFGENTNGLILNNYSPHDELASICRFAIAVSIAFTFPLPFIGTRDGILDLFSVDDELQTEFNMNILGVVHLSVIMALAWHFTDLGLLNAVGGAALGTVVVFVFPSIMFYAAVKNDLQASSKLKKESVFVLALMLAGIAMGALGIYVVVS